jgi:hypothetical protein
MTDATRNLGGAMRGEVNGILYSIRWDEGYKDYTIYFPQIEFTEEYFNQGIYDQVIRISPNKNHTYRVHEKFLELARQTRNLKTLYKQMERFIRSITR